MRNDRLYRFRTRATPAFWRTSIAGFGWRTHGLSTYPLPIQCSPRLVLAVMSMRWLAHRTRKEHALFAGRRPWRDASRREEKTARRAGKAAPAHALTRRTASGEKKLRVAARARVRLFEPKRALARRRLTAGAVTPRAVRAQRAMRSTTGAVRVRAPLRDSRSSSAGVRFVVGGGRVAPPARSERRRAAVIRDMPGWRARPPAARLPLQSAARSPAAAIERRLEASHRRFAARAEIGSRLLRVPNFRPFNTYVSLSRTTPRHGKRESTYGPARASSHSLNREHMSMTFLHERIVTLGPTQPFRPVSTVAATYAQHPARGGGARSRIAYTVHSGAIRAADTTYRLRWADRNAFGPYGHLLARRTASARRQRLVFARQRRSDFAAVGRPEPVARPLPLILRQRAVSRGLREQRITAPRQAYAMRESRRAYEPHRSGQPETRSQLAPAVEEVRRILIPLLRETLFSETTMGRLTSGVLTEVDRRDGAEHFRKTGGR